jgi:hypothetical protein
VPQPAQPQQPGYAPYAPYAPGQVPAYGQQPYPPVQQQQQQPRDPRLDEQLRYRQELGAYRRDPAGNVVPDAPAQTAYYRLADRTRYHHDGLYFRFALGIGAGHDSAKSDRLLPTQRLLLDAQPFEGSGGGFAGVTELAMGFTPGPGIVVGVGAYTVTIPKPTLSMKDTTTGDYEYRVSQLSVIGPLVDWYFNPTGGFHAQASPGVATYVAGAAEPKLEGAQAQAHTSVGFGFMLGVGYEWWIGQQWSMGLLGRFVYGTTKGNDDRGVQWSHASYAPAVLISATYH